MTREYRFVLVVKDRFDKYGCQHLYGLLQVQERVHIVVKADKTKENTREKFNKCKKKNYRA